MKSEIDDILYRVEKPSRYTGGELNEIHKDLEKVDVRYAFCFPDVYEVGMSHYGTKIMYNVINKREDTYCERVFAPWEDMEKELIQNNIELFSLETKDSIKNFDFLGFTLQYEMSYTNILNMLKLGNIEVLSKNRRNEDPIIMAGGPCAYNPEPLADFIDIFVIGEGEEVINEILDLYKEMKKEGFNKEEFLLKASNIKGVYVPSLYEVTYNEDNTIKEFKPIKENVPNKVTKRFIKDFDQNGYMDNNIVPYGEVVHDRLVVETFRGCSHGCRFCQAGMIYRPIREKKMDTILREIDEQIKLTGYEDISLMSLSICDHSSIQDLVYKLIEKYNEKKISISLPSIRVDAEFVDILKEIQKVKKTGLTLAPEAGSQRMRDVINKCVTEENLLSSVGHAFDNGWATIKLYFMIGLPYETLSDAEDIGKLSDKVAAEYFKVPKQKRNPGLRITISSSIFVPKPFTPFQWVKQETKEEIGQKIRGIKLNISSKAVKYKYHDSKISFLEAIVARGDRRVGSLILSAFNNGARFDGWSNMFKEEAWENAFISTGISGEFYANRDREYSEILPWDFIDIGVSKEFLIDENEKAKKAITTIDCRDKCINCGVNKSLAKGGCFENAICSKI